MHHKNVEREEQQKINSSECSNGRFSVRDWNLKFFFADQQTKHTKTCLHFPYNLSSVYTTKDDKDEWSEKKQRAENQAVEASKNCQEELKNVSLKFIHFVAYCWLLLSSMIVPPSFVTFCVTCAMSLCRARFLWHSIIIFLSSLFLRLCFCVK